MEQKKTINISFKLAIFLIIIITSIILSLLFVIYNISKNSSNNNISNSNNTNENYYTIHFQSGDLPTDPNDLNKELIPCDSTIEWENPEQDTYTNKNNYLIINSYEDWEKFNLKFPKLIKDDINKKN